MEGDERATLIFRREHFAVIEGHGDGRPVGRERRDRRLEFRAAAGGFSVAAVFRIQQHLLLAVIEEAKRPAEVVTLRRCDTCEPRRDGPHFPWLEKASPQRVSSLIAAVHGDPERAIVPRRWCGHLPQAGGVLHRAIRLLLVQACSHRTSRCRRAAQAVGRDPGRGPSRGGPAPDRRSKARQR